MTGNPWSAACVVGLTVFAVTPGLAGEPNGAKVTVLATPGGGIQPQAAVDRRRRWPRRRFHHHSLNGVALLACPPVSHASANMDGQAASATRRPL